MTDTISVSDDAAASLAAHNQELQRLLARASLLLELHYVNYRQTGLYREVRAAFGLPVGEG